MNQLITIPMPERGYDQVFDAESGTVKTERTIVASDLVQKIAVEKMNLDPENVNVDLEWGGITVETEFGEYEGAENTFLTFEDPRPTVKKAIEKARKQTSSEWWFDKEGTFNFTVPRPRRHELQLITDTDAGKTTPPYQSIRVIGSGTASQDGFSRSSMLTEDKIVLERELGVNEQGDTVPAEPDGDPQEPVFTYRNAEISTDAQAENVMKKLVEDLAEQQASGKITVVGFPEINPLDGVVMPQAKEPDAPNYDSNKPMGGAGYSVYEVTHRLNSSDGFITIIKAGGVIGATKTAVQSDESEAEARRKAILTSEGVVQGGRQKDLPAYE